MPGLRAGTGLDQELMASLKQARRGGRRGTAFDAWDPAGAGARVRTGAAVRELRWAEGTGAAALSRMMPIRTVMGIPQMNAPKCSGRPGPDARKEDVSRFAGERPSCLPAHRKA